MTTTHRDDSIDDGGLLDGDAQGLHVEVEEGIEDGHGGRLEQEDKLDPHLVRISLTNWWFSYIMMMRIGSFEICYFSVGTFG